MKIKATPAAQPKPLKAPFPGPSGASAVLRVAIDRSPHAELMGHAQESLNAEVCGVLVGRFAQDNEGIYTHVQAMIRGHAASEASTSVTFTQATWNAIHETMDRDYPKLSIVGWYHTHPGFGVEFSDMDLFIQSNFFSGPAQIAFVTDPLTGAVAIACNPQGNDAPADPTAKPSATYLPRYWLDGREHKAQVPTANSQPQPANSADGKPTLGGPSETSSSATAAALDNRIAQLTHALDELRDSLHQAYLIAGVIICLGVCVTVAWFIRESFRARVEPPQLAQYLPMPIKIGDKNMMLGVSIVNWEVPAELNAILLDAQKAKEEAEAATKAEAEKVEAATKTEAATKAEAEKAAATPTLPPPAQPK